VVRIEGDRTPGFKLMLALVVGFVLTIPLLSVYFLASDRESQSREAARSITAGWGGPQTMSGPLLVIPYKATTTETVLQNGQSVTKTNEVARELTVAPEIVEMTTGMDHQVKKRSIYEAVLFDAHVQGKARFAFPPDLGRTGVQLSQMDLSKAELRFGLSDPRGLGANPSVSVGGRPLRLQPGGGSSGKSRGFFAWLDAGSLPTQPIVVDFSYKFRGNGSLSLSPDAGDTHWVVKSAWPSPSFVGGFLPDPGLTQVAKNGFHANYRIGNLALGNSLVTTNDAGDSTPQADRESRENPYDLVPGGTATSDDNSQVAQINLIQPVDLYSQVDRAIKYGFLFIGFTFLALLMFDVIGGVSVSPVEYLLMGVALILFFVMLLAFAEVIGFTPAYILASAAIAGLNTAYSAAVLNSWRRAAFIGALLIGLYAVLYILLSLEAFSLLIGSLLLFAALAGVMYATRRIDWGGKRGEEAVAEA
jgi:inner membrane protein